MDSTAAKSFPRPNCPGPTDRPTIERVNERALSGWARLSVCLSLPRSSLLVSVARRDQREIPRGGNCRRRQARRTDGRTDGGDVAVGLCLWAFMANFRLSTSCILGRRRPWWYMVPQKRPVLGCVSLHLCHHCKDLNYAVLSQ